MCIRAHPRDTHPRRTSENRRALASSRSLTCRSSCWFCSCSCSSALPRLSSSRSSATSCAPRIHIVTARARSAMSPRQVEVPESARPHRSYRSVAQAVVANLVQLSPQRLVVGLDTTIVRGSRGCQVPSHRTPARQGRAAHEPSDKVAHARDHPGASGLESGEGRAGGVRRATHPELIHESLALVGKDFGRLEPGGNLVQGQPQGIALPPGRGERDRSRQCRSALLRRP